MMISVISGMMLFYSGLWCIVIDIVSVMMVMVSSMSDSECVCVWLMNVLLMKLLFDYVVCMMLIISM